MTPELHRPVPIDRIGPRGLDVLVEATPAECAALARRMDLPAIQSLACRFHLERDTADRLVAYGELHAHVVQTCVVSLEDFAAAVTECFTVRFVPAGEEDDDADPETPDDIGYEGNVLDLGEAAAEQLALALDPYPHGPDAVLPELPDSAAAGPFAGLAGLRRRQ